MRLQLGVAGQSLDAEDDSDPGWVAGEDGDDDPESLQVADSQTSAQQTGIPAGPDPGGAKDEETTYLPPHTAAITRRAATILMVTAIAPPEPGRRRVAESRRGTPSERG